MNDYNELTLEELEARERELRTEIEAIRDRRNEAHEERHQSFARDLLRQIEQRGLERSRILQLLGAGLSIPSRHCAICRLGRRSERDALSALSAGLSIPDSRDAASRG